MRHLFCFPQGPMQPKSAQTNPNAAGAKFLAPHLQIQDKSV